MSRPRQTGGIRGWAACACLVALLLAASVDTGHVCGTLRALREVPAGASRVEAAAGYCPICALAQPATPGGPIAVLALSLSATAAGAVPEPQPHSFHGLFALNVRPPPA